MNAADYYPDPCTRCNCCSLEWESCWNCGGEGEIDRYEDDPLWYIGKWRYQRCYNCNGKGGYDLCGGRCDANGVHSAAGVE